MSGPVPLRAEIGSFVEAVGLEVIYPLGSRRIRALTGIDLRVPQGQFLCVRGKSGSGKSTLLHALAGLRKPTAGRVRVGDIDVHELSARHAALYRRRVVGIVFQFFNLLPMLTVAQNVAFPLSLDGARGAALDEKVDELLADLAMLDRRDNYPDQLSGGEMQRIAIARALAIHPDLILADEPTGNLDSAAGNQIWLLLQDLCRKRRVTTIMVTHDADATAYADRVVVLEDGEIVEDTDDRSWASV